MLNVLISAALALATKQGSACPGTQYPQLRCDAISAQAAVDQVSQADRSSWLLEIELCISALTAAGAIAAAAFAARASSAASKSYQAFVAAEDATLAIDFPKGTTIEIANPEKAWTEYQIEVMVVNLGRSPARLHRWTMGDRVTQLDATIAPGATYRIHYVDFLAAERFEFQIHYSTPLHPTAVLTVTGGAEARKGNIPPVVARLIKTEARFTTS